MDDDWFLRKALVSGVGFIVFLFVAFVLWLLGVTR